MDTRSHFAAVVPRHLVALIAGVLVHAGAAISAQDQLWLRTYGAPIHPHEVASQSIPDGAGAAFFAGNTEASLDGPSAGGGDGWLSRYAADGSRLWLRQFGTGQDDYPGGLAPDDAGGAYVAGNRGSSLTDRNVFLIRFDAAGNELWDVSFGSFGTDDWLNFAAPDGAGGVYVGGRTDGDTGGTSSGGIDAWIARYDALGNRVWIRQLGTDADDEARSGAPDGAGGLFVGGSTWGALGGPPLGELDAWLAHYDPAGNLTWIRQFGTEVVEGLYAAAADGGGGVYTSGLIVTADGSETDAWLKRFDAAGNQMWTVGFDLDSEDYPMSASPDESGGVFLVGYSGPMWEVRGWIAHYDEHGQQLWLRTLEHSGPNDYLGGVAANGLGGAFACGSIAETSGAFGGGVDALVMRYDESGNRPWIERFGSDSRERTNALAPDGSDGVFAAGATNSAFGGPNVGSADAWLARHDGTGDPLWIAHLGTRDTDVANATAADGAGGVFVGGSTRGSLGGTSAGGEDAWLARYDSAGARSWILQLGTEGDEAIAAAAPDGAGGAYVAGTTTGALGAAPAGLVDAWLARYDGAGNALWIVQLGTELDDVVLAAAADPLGGVWIGGATDGALGGPAAGAGDAWLARFDGSGSATWIRQLGTPARDALRALVVGPGGGAYVGGDTEGDLGAPNAGATDAWIARTDPGGDVLWIEQLGTSAPDTLAAVALDLAGEVFVGGTTQGDLEHPPEQWSDAWIAHVDALGNRTWLRQFGSATRDWLLAAAPDGSGGVFVGGTFELAYLSDQEDPWLARYEGACRAASASPRNSGANVASLQASAPSLGGVCDVTVDLTTTGHAFAVLYALDGAVDLPWHSGWRILVADLHGHGTLYRAARAGPLAAYALSVPTDPALCGFALHLQAAHVGGAASVALSNAQDLLLGW